MLIDRNTKVKSLWRYPVKSLLGEELQKVRVDLRGFEADREFAVVNTEGKLGSGKNTRRFVQIENLFSLSSKKEGDQFVVELPSGVRLPVLSRPLDDQLSEYLGQKVTVEQESKVPHFDDGSVHIITTGGLSSLEKMIPKGHVDERRFRPNIVLDADFDDNQLLGKTIEVGSVRLEVTDKMRRCRMVTLEQRELLHAPEILKAITITGAVNFGVYARVISPGVICRQSKIRIVEGGN